MRQDTDVYRLWSKASAVSKAQQRIHVGTASDCVGQFFLSFRVFFFRLLPALPPLSPKLSTVAAQSKPHPVDTSTQSGRAHSASHRGLCCKCPTKCSVEARCVVFNHPTMPGNPSSASRNNFRATVLPHTTCPACHAAPHSRPYHARWTACSEFICVHTLYVRTVCMHACSRCTAIQKSRLNWHYRFANK